MRTTIVYPRITRRRDLGITLFNLYLAGLKCDIVVVLVNNRAVFKLNDKFKIVVGGDFGYVTENRNGRQNRRKNVPRSKATIGSLIENLKCRIRMCFTVINSNITIRFNLKYTRFNLQGAVFKRNGIVSRHILAMIINDYITRKLIGLFTIHYVGNGRTLPNFNGMSVDEFGGIILVLSMCHAIVRPRTVVGHNRNRLGVNLQIAVFILDVIIIRGLNIIGIKNVDLKLIFDTLGIFHIRQGFFIYYRNLVGR